jgi:hypothetical protein
MKELKDLVVGDDVLVKGMNHIRIAKVDKVTKTQIVVNNARFRRIRAGNAVVIDGMLEKYLFLQKRKYQMLKKRIFVRLSSTLSVLLISNAYQQMS